MDSTDQTGTTHAAPLTEAQRDELIDQIRLRAGDLHKGTSLSGGNTFQNIIRDLMLTCPDQTVIAIHEYFMFEESDDPREYREQCRERGELIGTLTGPRYKENGNTLHEYIIFKESIAGSIGSLYGLAIVSLLHKYEQLPAMDSYSNANEETKVKIAALIKVTSSLFGLYKEHERAYLGSPAFKHQGNSIVPTPKEYGLPLDYDWTGIRLHGDDLINLILEQHENADEIASIMTKDGITDPDLLREIFSSKTPALRHGLI
jgi:hypothetical protein